MRSGSTRATSVITPAIKPAGSKLGSGAVLGVIDGTSVLIETIPQSSGSHSVAADCKRNRIFVPQVFSSTAPPPGGLNHEVNTTAGAGSPTVGALICGSNNGCIAVYQHDVDNEDNQGKKHNVCQTNDDQGDHND